MIFKRHIAVLLVVVLLVGMMPMQIFAVETTVGSWADPDNYTSNWLSYQINIEEHDGSATNPYIIYNNEDLAAFSYEVNNGNNFWDKTIKLTGDLDLSEHFWVPIGFWTKSFEGTFNGNNKKISGVKIGTASNPDSGTECLGLFGSTVGATVKSLGVGVEIYSSKANATIGGLIGNINNNSIVQNCYTTGTIVSEGSYYVGGLGGMILNYAKIQNSCSSVNIIGNNLFCVGGLVGSAFTGEIHNSYSTGAVSASTSLYVGGFSGYNEKENIENCYWNTDNLLPAVTSGSAIGITGKTDSELRSNEFSTLLNENESSVLGLCKWQSKVYDNNSLFSPTTLSTISFNLNGGVGSTPSNMYAELGVYFLFEVSTANIIPPEGKIFDCWNTKQDGSGFRFVNGKNDKYDEDVVLYAIYRDVTWQDEGNYDTVLYDQLSTPSGWASVFDNGGILKIGTARELAAFAKACDGGSYSEYLNACIASYQAGNVEVMPPQGGFVSVKLTNDIDLSEFPWTPIAAYESLSGATCLTFDGNSKTISNLTIDGDYDSAGLFGGAMFSVIKNLTVSGNIIGEYHSAGGIVGGIGFCDIENCISDIDIDVMAFAVGGMAGRCMDVGIPSHITNSVNKGSIQGDFLVSGICNGENEDIAINNCYNIGALPFNAYPISNSYTGGNNYYLDTSFMNMTNDSGVIEVTDEYMKSTAFVSDLNVWVDVHNSTTPDKYSSWIAVTNDYPVLEQTGLFDISATVTALNIADQPVLEADTKITVPIKASFDKDVTLTEIEYSISYNNTAFSIYEDDYIGLSPIVTQIGTTSTLKLTKTFANQPVLTGAFETIDFKPIVIPTAMAGEQLITIVPKITILKDEGTYVLGTTQYPIITVNGTVNLTKPLYYSGAMMFTSPLIDSLNIDKTEIPLETDYNGKVVLVNGQIKIKVPFAKFSNIPTSTASFFGIVTFDEDVLTFDSITDSSSGFTAEKTGTNEIRINGDCDDSENLNTLLQDFVLNFTLNKIPENLETSISSNDFCITEKNEYGIIDVNRKENLALNPKTQIVRFVDKQDPNGVDAENYIRLILNEASSTGDEYKTYTFPSLLLTSNKDITGARVYITDGYNTSDRIGQNNYFANQITNGVTIKVTNGGKIITLTGTASPAVYQDILNKISIKLINTNVSRNIVFEAYNPNSTVVVNGTSTNIIPFYNPDNGHLYEYVPSTNVKWTTAVGLAPQRSIGGMTGYLATVTAPEENAILTSLCAGQGWLGGSQDMTTLNTMLSKNFTGQGYKYTSDYLNPNMAQGKWFWVTGPEAGQQFYKQTAPQASYNLAIPGSNLGMYNNWLPTYEPNNYGNIGENYLHIYPTNGKWNDYMNNQNGIGGYVVEYGGLKSDSPSAISMARVSTSLLNPFEADPILLTVALPVIPSAVNSGYTLPLYGASTTYTWVESGTSGTLEDGYKLMNTSGVDKTIVIRATGIMTGAQTATKDYTITVLATRAAITVPTPVLGAVGKNAKVALSWQAISNANYYEVYYKAAGGDYSIEPVIVNGPSTEVAGLTNGTAYTFKIIAALDNSLKSVESNEANVTPIEPATYLTDIIIKNGSNTYAITPAFNADKLNYIVTIPSNIGTVDISTTKIGDGIITGEGGGISVNSPATVSIHSADPTEDKTYTITFVIEYSKVLLNYTYTNPTASNGDGHISLAGIGGTGVGYQFLVEGVSSWSYIADFTTLPEGTYLVQAMDNLGHFSEIVSINLVADDKQPLGVNFGEYSLYYDGSPQSRSFTITPDTLLEEVDYTVSYSDMQGGIIDKPSLAGIYQVTITVNADQPNYYGRYQALFEIIELQAPDIAIDDVEVSGGYKINGFLNYSPAITYHHIGNETQTCKWEYSSDGSDWTTICENDKVYDSVSINANMINKNVRYTVTAYQTVNGHNTAITTAFKTIILKQAPEGIVTIPTITSVNLINDDGSEINDGNRARHNKIIRAVVMISDDPSSVVTGTYYQWYRDGQIINGETDYKYTLQKEDVGRNISVKAANQTDYVAFDEVEYIESNIVDIYADTNMAPFVTATSSNSKFTIGEIVSVDLDIHKYYDNVVDSNITDLKYGVVSSDESSAVVIADLSLSTNAPSIEYTIDSANRYIIFKIQATETTLGDPIAVKTSIYRIDTLTGIAVNWVYKLDYVIKDNDNFNDYKVYQIITNIGPNNTAKMTVDNSKVYDDKAKMYYSPERGKYVVLMPADVNPDLDKFVIETGSTDTIFYGKQGNTSGDLNVDDVNKSIQLWLRKITNVDYTNFVLTEVAGDGVIDPNDAAQIASVLLSGGVKAGRLGILSK